jgi:hypothetical protein
MNPPIEQIKKLCAIQIKRFTGRVEAGKKGNPIINLAECEHYLKIWKNIEAKEYDYRSLNREERSELFDAICEDEDDGS